jgi:hypothetical protein
MKLIDRSFCMAIRRLLILLVSLLQAQCVLAQSPTVMGGSLDQWRDLKGTSLPPSSSLPRSIQKMDGHSETLDRYLFFPMGGVMMQDTRVSVFSDMDNLLSDVLDPFCGKLTYDSHIGVDSTILTFVEQKAGVPVFAVLGGSVIEVGNGVKDGPDAKPVDSEQLGNYVAIDHGNGHVTRYLHLREKSILVSVGDVVQAGQQIGLVGSSGVRYWPPHLTFQTLVDGKFVEPFKGDCSNSESLWWDQDSILRKVNYEKLIRTEPDGDYQKPYIGNFVVTQDDLSRWQGPPFDTSRTATIVKGLRELGIWFQFFNLDKPTKYFFTIRRPDGEIFQEVTGTLRANLSGWWGFNWDSNNELNFDETSKYLDQLGYFLAEERCVDWQIEFELGSIQLKYPLRVVKNNSHIRNRPPNPIEVEFMHGAVSTEDVPVCRVKGNEPVLDPDFDFVRFRYVWKVNGKEKRTFISGARSDALPKGEVKQGDVLICEVTPLDANFINPPDSEPDGYLTAVAKTVVFTPFSVWASAHGISVQDYDSDPDRDGYPNALEYLLDRDPNFNEGFLDFEIVDKTNLILVDIPKKSDPRALFTLQTCTDLFTNNRATLPQTAGLKNGKTGKLPFIVRDWEVVPPVSPTRQRTWLFGGPFDSKRFFNMQAVMPDEPSRTVLKNKIVPIPR